MKTDVRIALTARAPVAGQCKTRLIPRLGAQGAARLHAALVERALREIAVTGLPAELWCDPSARDPFLVASARKFGAALREQGDGDLGERMARIFMTATAPLLLMGSDCPTIDAALLARCANELADGAPAVFLPAEDGGYGLVGLRAPIPEIFADMPWGTDAVMALTRERLAMRGVPMCEPAVVWDVDWPADVDRLAATGFPIPAFAD